MTDAVGRVSVDGETAPGFEFVRAVFEANVDDVGPGGAAFAVSCGGMPLVDLWAGSAGPTSWSRGTRAVMMSVTKGVAAAAVARLVDAGRLCLDDPIVEVWPEFAPHGKNRASLIDILTHSIGLPVLPGGDRLLHPGGDFGWDSPEPIAEALAAAKPLWPPGQRHGYHALTFGWLLAETVRRATGTSLGQQVEELLAQPLGLELSLGTPICLQGMIAPVHLPLEPHQREQLLGAESRSGSRVADAVATTGGRNLLTEAEVFFSNPSVLEAEIASSNATATARALARLFDALASPSEAGGVLSSHVRRRFTTEQWRGLDAVAKQPARWALGFTRPVREYAVPDGWGPSESAFGHAGFGGQWAVGDLERGVGWGFLRSALTASSSLVGALVAATYECLDSWA